MKQGIIFLVLLSSTLPALPQNLQVHYDLGADRRYITTTLEMFRPDSMGSTFFFTDFDYDMDGKGSMSLSYFEIARYVTLPLLDRKLDLTLQFNDGHAGWEGRVVPLGQVWLAGLSYPIDLNVIEIKTDLLFRKADYSDGTDWQVTVTWFRPFLDERLLFTGFIDLWSEDRGQGKRAVLLSEPQLWYNVWKQLFAGGEVEISHHFLPDDELHLFPTLGLLWNF